MDAITAECVVAEFMRQVPGARDVLDDIRERDPGLGDDWERGNAPDLLEFFLSAFSGPVLLPLLQDESATPDDLEPCFRYLEGLCLNEETYFRSSVEFGILEQFLESREMVLRAYARSLPKTRERVTGMLSQYPDTYAGIRGDLDSVDGV
ncbi:hypothetical protein DIZ27_37990 [Streptomyces sp. NWU339]|uniref:hypothetical protein n=1 Tax=Streptomyces sp. NWU339 TaxID=2185284 RepID=UPI000D683826|nr:hypothetical protein [Streptomyces sp. NWU339]PWI05637.1 hypothetical protein DIZ27_37990 [Streptomyces sp. NWU339]